MHNKFFEEDSINVACSSLMFWLLGYQKESSGGHANLQQ